MRDFIKFIREQGVVGLAIGFLVGAAVGKIVTSLVTDIIQPIIGIIFNSSGGMVNLHLGPIMYGRFLGVLIDFVIISLVVYFGFKKLGLEKLDTKKEK